MELLPQGEWSMTRTLRLDVLLIGVFKSTSFRFSSEISFSVFSPGHSSVAVTQKPSSLPSSGQTSDQGSAASQSNAPEHSLTSVAQPKPPSAAKQEDEIHQTSRAKPAPQCSVAQKQPMKGLDVATNEEEELVRSSVVPWPLPPGTNTGSTHSDTKHTNMNLNKINNEAKVVGMAPDSDSRRDEDTSKDTHTTKSPQINNLHTQIQTPDLNQLTKDQELEEEERSLMAKIHQMTGDTSPGPRSMKRLIPNPREIDCDTAELVDHSQHLIIPRFDALQEISLTEAEDPLADRLGRNTEGEEDV